MAGLGTTTMQLNALRSRWRDKLSEGAGQTHAASPAGRAGHADLHEVSDFGSNPGHLRMFAFAPATRAASPALVLVLHGCTQDAAGYDAGAGWSTLAQRHGFVVVLAQQTSSNNQNACFNWFLPSDTTRDKGEVLSMRQMVEHAAVAYGVDRDRIFVTGLSAGGAMAAAMLAAYPDVFAGGGIVAGLPYGVATNLHQALGAMYGGGTRAAHELGDHVRAASPVGGTWPRVSIWHGTGDTTVKPNNADDLVRQWTDVHGLDASAPVQSHVDGQVRQVWCDASGREVVEAFQIAGMGHGTPLQVSGNDDTACGEAGAFLLDVGISSSYHMAAFWGLVGPEPVRRTRDAAAVAPAAEAPRGRVEILPPLPKSSAHAEPRQAKSQPGGEIGAVITDALRRAGLM